MNEFNLLMNHTFYRYLLSLVLAVMLGGANCGQIGKKRDQPKGSQTTTQTTTGVPTGPTSNIGSVGSNRHGGGSSSSGGSSHTTASKLPAHVKAYLDKYVTDFYLPYTAILDLETTTPLVSDES